MLPGAACCSLPDGTKGGIEVHSSLPKLHNLRTVYFSGCSQCVNAHLFVCICPWLYRVVNAKTKHFDPHERLLHFPPGWRHHFVQLITSLLFGSSCEFLIRMSFVSIWDRLSIPVAPDEILDDTNTTRDELFDFVTSACNGFQTFFLMSPRFTPSATLSTSVLRSWYIQHPDPYMWSKSKRWSFSQNRCVTVYFTKKRAVSTRTLKRYEGQDCFCPDKTPKRIHWRHEHR